MRRSPPPVESHDDVDLNPLVDVVTILIVFFLIGGRLAQPQDGITVPPGRTGAVIRGSDAALVTIDVRGDGQRIELGVGPHRFAGGALEREPYAALRGLLDAIHDRSPKRPDGAADVRLRIRADQDTPYRAVQGVLALAADVGEDPAAGRLRRPFTDLSFAVRGADGG